MPDSPDHLTVRTIEKINEVPTTSWDRCAGPNNPFTSHAFLSALEDSGSAAAEEGWLPRHVLIEDGAGSLLGCAPLYVKGHSYGEYVFDHAWADAYERAGGRYYPKLLSGVPFTPVTGPRFLISPAADEATVRDALIGALVRIADETGVSSLHINFLTEAEWARCGRIGLLQRIGEQYHWHNSGYESFDDFLGALNSRKRKAIRKERQQALASGLTIRALNGTDLRPVHWDAFFRFYVGTSDRKWGWPYLNRAFFDLLGERMADRVVLFMVEDEDRPVAGALNLVGTDAIYGRNWGCDQAVRFLHFEACYYQAIEYAIRHGLSRVEAGAQGPHKIQRGYMPTRTYSAHWIRNASLADAVKDFLGHESRAIGAEIAALAQQSPYRKDR